MLTKTIDFLIAATFFRFTSIYSSFIYRASLNADLLFAYHKFKARRSLVKFYWLYKIIKSFIFCSNYTKPITDNSSADIIGRVAIVVDKSDNWVLRGLEAFN